MGDEKYDDETVRGLTCRALDQTSNSEMPPDKAVNRVDATHQQRPLQPEERTLEFKTAMPTDEKNTNTSTASPAELSTESDTTTMSNSKASIEKSMGDANLPLPPLTESHCAIATDDKKLAIELDSISEGVGRLSVNYNHKSSCQHNPTAQSVIARIAELAQTPPGCRLVSHAPDSTSGQVRGAKKRGSTDTDTGTVKVPRSKEPSEQDERVGEYKTESWLSTVQNEIVMNILWGVTNDKVCLSQLINDIVSFDQENQVEFAMYLEGNNFAQLSPYQTDPESPNSVDCASPTSRDSPSDDASLGSPCNPDYYHYPNSPPFKDVKESNIPSIGSPPSNLTNSEAYMNLSDESMMVNTAGCSDFPAPNIPPCSYLVYPPANSIITKQMDQVNQTAIVNGDVHKRHLTLTQPPGVAETGTPAMTSPGFNTTANVKIAPQKASTNIGHLGFAKNCGCGVGSCQHRNIAPKNMLSNSPPHLQPIDTPARIPEISEIIDKLPREELVRARRWVASIKTADLKKSDKDGDLALHIVVATYEFPKLIALLERCQRENIVNEVINKINIRTQTLLFLALVAAPRDEQNSESAADMISILLEYNANPLVTTILHSNNSTDNRYCCPIHIVAQQGNRAVPIMQRLLTTSVSEQLSVSCDSKQTALHYAAQQPNSDQMVYELIRQGADLNRKEGKRGRTPLHYLLETHNTGLVARVLLMVGAEKARQAVQVTAYDGCTALHIAALLCMDDVEQHKQLLKLLLASGAEPGTKNSQNQKAVDLIPKERRELCSMLKTSLNKTQH